MIVQILTVNGQPEFEFYAWDASEIDAEVERRHTRQASGTPHNWRGLTSGSSRLEYKRLMRDR